MTTALVKKQTTAMVHQPRIVFYRFQETLWSESKIILILAKFPLLKKTAKGAWIEVYGIKKFVLLDARKHYACPTEKEALASYHARKKRQARLLRHQLKRAEAAAKLQHDGEQIYFR